MSDASQVCLADSTTISWTIDLSALEANALLSESSGNVLLITSSGVYAPGPRWDSWRWANTGSVAIATGAQVQAFQNVIRFADPVGVSSPPGATINGLYHCTAVGSWSVSAAGSFRLLGFTTNSLVTAPQYTFVTQTAGLGALFTSNQWVTQFDGIVPLRVGDVPIIVAQQDSGGALNLLGANERIGCEFMANLIMEA